MAISEKELNRRLARFGDRVRILRLTERLSQEKLAEIAGVHRNYIGQLERAERNVGVATVFRIADALNVKPEELFRAAD